MGIPKLATLITPYASRISFSSSGENFKGLPNHQIRDEHGSRPVEQTAIIDGPALSYHAYGRAVASRNNASNALDALPVYDEVNKVLLECLSALEQHGFKIVAIFFDGVLPSSKEPTRFERLNSYRKQLEKFRSLNPSLIADPGTNRRLVPKSSFSFSSVPEKLTGLPALPFLVPAVIEALGKSRFRDQTRVVPAEADVYCANHANLNGGTIFTSDSDLLVYDMAENTSVVLFKDIELIESSIGNVESRKSALQITKFDPAAIARRLDLESLEPFAYAVQKDHYRGFNGCLNYARKLQANENLSKIEVEAYQDFVQQYCLSVISLTPSKPILGKTLQRLDPRISEWIHLAMDSHIRNGKDGQEVKTIDYAEQVLDMYLPFPIDDPSRATSWTLGISIRQLAYSILRHGKHTTNEWTRRGPRIAEKKVEHLSSQQALDRLWEWTQILLPLHKQISENVLVWRLVGVYSVCLHLLEIERPLPGREVLWNLLSRKNHGARDWTAVHFEAQVQAVLYSWRLLHQCILVHMALREEKAGQTASDADLNLAIDGVSHMLNSLPTIPLLFDAPAEGEMVKHALSQLYKLLGVEEQEDKPRDKADDDGFKAANKQRRKRKKDELKSKLPAPKTAKTPRVANLFDVLGVDR